MGSSVSSSVGSTVDTAVHAALEQWRLVCGPKYVLSAEAAAAAYGQDTSGSTRRMVGALRVSHGHDLQAIMRIVHHHKVPVYPISTGHNWGYGSALPVQNDCVILDLSALNRITHFDATLGVVTVQPGVTQAMLADFLEAGNHPFLVPVTGAGPSCSLLGNALERGYGVTPLADHFAAVTDLEAVLPDGSLYRSALREAAGEELARLFKWGIGPYFTGLFTQSGFGVVTRVTLLLSRRPACVKVCLFSLKDDALLESAVDRIHTLLCQLPGTLGGINLMNQRRVLSMSAPYPADQVGADGVVPQAVVRAMGQAYQVAPWTGFATLYGTQRMVRAAQQEMKAALNGLASRVLFITPERAHQLSRVTQWLPGKTGQRLGGLTATLAKSLELAAGRPNETALPLAYWRHPAPPDSALKNPAQDGCGLTWYAPLVPMRSASVRAYAQMVEQITPRFGIEPLITFTSQGERLFDSTVPLLFERDRAGAVAAAAACYEQLFDSGRAQGWFPYRLGIEGMAQLATLQQDSKVFQARLRKDLDPFDLMSPGRYR